MRFFSTISDLELSTDAAGESAERALEAMEGRVDVAFLFLTPHHREEADVVVEQLWLELDPQILIGCMAEGVIGGDREIERRPGLALLTGELPGARLHPFHIAGQNDWRTLLEDPAALADRIGYGPDTRAVIGLGDPFTSPMSQLLAAFDKTLGAAPLVGGMASGVNAPGQTLLFRNDECRNDGFVGVTVGGAVEVETVVSQGCRPIGRPWVVTKSHENVIDQLGGRPAMAALTEIVQELSEADRKLLQNGLFVGQAINEYRDEWGRGDFLVRNVVDVDDKNGSIAIADWAKAGRTVQFHIRDAHTASEDLSLLLDTQSKRPDAPAGGLLISCNGRGRRMFSQENHDIAHSRRAMPNTPMAGFFAAGELGPVGGKNFIHGHTASFALFRQAKAIGSK